MTRRILFLSCSDIKRAEPGLMPALHRYDGPAYRTLKANNAESVRLFILSAEHGLISGGDPIATYDRLMTPARARELEPLVRSEIRRAAERGELEGEILVYGGELYRSVLTTALGAADLLERTTFTRGGIGEQLGQLKAWLNRENGQ